MNQARSLLQESLVAIERLQARVRDLEGRGAEPIAIVGASCRFPGANDPQALWALLRDRKDVVRDVPSDRWDESYYDPRPNQPGKMSTRRGGFLEGLDQFDPQFFGVSSREATALDPQHRLLLETAQEAIEAAAIPTDALMRSRTGVFVGISTTDYGQIMLEVGLENVDIYAANGGALNTAAGRISFVYGLEGPAMAVDTACSSSLVAIHLAVQSLRRRESDLALASGVNVILQPAGMVLFSQWGLMAPDGSCKTFDDGADGFVRAEGCGTIVLKRLSDALEADDPILAVIRGTAVNSDGRSSGLTAPHGPSQEAVIRAALKDAGLQPADIDYVEAHGTGTPIGDPIEIEAIGSVMREGGRRETPLLVGSIKPNIGHGESSAGMAGLFKIMASLAHEAIPANIHLHTPNRRVDWDALPLRLATDQTAWPRRSDRPRRAGISGFGFSGTNAHVILEEAPLRRPAPAAKEGKRLALLSARVPQALQALAARHLAFLDAHPEASLADVLATLAAGRAHLQRRLAFPVGSLAELRDGLQAAAAGQLPAGGAEGSVRIGEGPRVAFLFTGQGSQYPGMGRQLYDAQPAFRAAVDRCAEILKGRLDVDLRDLLLAEGPGAPDISLTGYTQPALFAFEYALSELWRSWGVQPTVVAGHSVGEYVAACVAGVFSLEDALLLIAERGRLMQALPAGGAMAAIFTDEATVDAALKGFEGRVAKAAINGAEEIVISGEADSVEQVVARLRDGGAEAKRLEVSHAFHSPLLDPMLDALEQAAARVKHAAPRITLISNVTGKAFAPGAAPDATYWRTHARQAVRFADCVAAMAVEGVGALVELGPHPVLLGMAARVLPGQKWLRASSLHRGRDARDTLLAALRDLHVGGVSLDWAAITKEDGGRRIALPPQPFLRERYWTDRPTRRGRRISGEHPLLGSRQVSPAPGDQFFGEVSLAETPWIGDHVVLDTVLMPGAGFLEMSLAAAQARTGSTAVSLTNFVIGAQLRFEDDKPAHLHTQIEPAAADGGALLVVRGRSSADGDAWSEHARATVQPATGAMMALAAPSASEARGRATETIQPAQIYKHLAEIGLAFGDDFRPLRSIAFGDGVAVGEVEAPGGSGYLIHPVLIDGAFQLMACLISRPSDLPPDEPDPVFVPLGIEAVQFLAPADGRRLTAVATLTEGDVNSGSLRADAQLERPDGTPVLRLRGLHIQRITREAMEAVQHRGMTDQRLVPEWTALPDREPGARARTLVLIDDDGGLAGRLAAASTRATVVRREALAAALRDLRESDALVVDLVSPPHGAAENPALFKAASLAALGTVRQVAELAPKAGYCLLTRGALAIEPGEAGQPAHGALAGLMRAVAAEKAGHTFGMLDLDPAMPVDPGLCLKALAVLSPEEPALAIRRGVLRGQRLTVPVRPSVPDGARRVLAVAKRGDLDGLTIETTRRRPPVAGEVEIAVAATGVNFRDVLIVLGMVGDETITIGSECAGVVSAVGEGVTSVSVGDRVVGLGSESFGTYATVAAQFVVRLPDTIGFPAAVTLPNAYLTGWLALDQLPSLGPDHTVLVHAAAGGVGAATVRLAHRKGATVIATASSAEKRAFALAQGAAHCFDSRSPSFLADVLRVTDGRGVDLVVNSLTGELLQAGMRALKPGGIFVEIGKTEIWTTERVATEAPEIVYAVVDLGAEIVRAPGRVRNALELVLQQVGRGELAALPVQAFPFDAAVDAFRFMANARHIGKVVLTMPPLFDHTPVRADGTYLVTGGLGGIGLALADWLAHKGAGAIVLAGRSAPDAERLARIAQLRAAGAQVVAFQGDVGDPATLERLRSEGLAGLPPLRGVFHAAGVLADAPLDEQDAERFGKVARPKADAALLLHAFTRGDPLDMFVLFSSTSSVLGSAGQANYAAANGLLNSLAGWRKAQGLPATAVAWGAWADVGMAAGLGEAAAARWSRLGIGLMPPAAGFALMDAAIASGDPLSVALRLNRRVFENRGGPAVRALLGAPPAAAEAASDTGAVAIREQLATAASAEREALLREFVRREVARVLGFSPHTLDVNTPLSALGFDSLMAVMVHGTLVEELGVSMPLKELLRSPTITELAAATLALTPAGEASELASGGAVEWDEGTI